MPLAHHLVVVPPMASADAKHLSRPGLTSADIILHAALLALDGARRHRAKSGQ